MNKPLIEVLRIGKHGEVLLPRKVRAALGWQQGDELILTADDKRIILERRARGLSTYLDAMSSDPAGEAAAVRSAPPRRELGRFLRKR